MLYWVLSSRGADGCCVVIILPSTEYVSLMTWSAVSEQIVYVRSPDSKKRRRTRRTVLFDGRSVTEIAYPQPKETSVSHGG
jgi:hypothetical protein